MKTETCPECDGKGIVDQGTDDERQCSNCGGTGVVLDDDDDGNILNTQSRVLLREISLTKE